MALSSSLPFRLSMFGSSLDIGIVRGDKNTIVSFLGGDYKVLKRQHKYSSIFNSIILMEKLEGKTI